MVKTIKLSRSVNDICTEYPEMMEVMKELGFKDLSPAMLATAGRFMTIPMGAMMKKLDLEAVKAELEKRGYSVKE
ncbi:DUF1858 domain-containing protein [Bacillota bacterium]